MLTALKMFWGKKMCELKTIPQVYTGDIVPVDGDVACELDTGVGGVSYSDIVPILFILFQDKSNVSSARVLAFK